VADRYTDILVVDLLGGIGDLLMILPAIHGLARRNPGATLRVLTYDPGAELIRGDPAVTAVQTPAHGGPGAAREAVRTALADRRPDLAITTTRYDGIPTLLADGAGRCVTDLWRRPPADELVTTRYLRILHEEGLLDRADLGAVPRVFLTGEEIAAGQRALVALLPPARPAAPVVLVTDAGMAVKRWPARNWRRLAADLSAHGHAVLGVTPHGPGIPLPQLTLRQLAGLFAAVAARHGVVVGGDTGPVRLAAATGAGTVALFGPTLAKRYGMGESSGAALQGLPGCPHRRPTSITEQICWWDNTCPLMNAEPACMADIAAQEVTRAVLAKLSHHPSGPVVSGR
jgi:ADP-heptose:LPS heptosyltransferase